MGKMAILITTIYKASSVIQAIKRFSPKKVYFVIDEPLDDVRKNSILMVKDLFPEIQYGENIKTKIYDIVNIARECIKTIEKEKENKIFVNISEGRKTMSIGVLFGSYVMKKYIDSVYYIMEETNQPIQLPLIDLKVSEKKEMILKAIEKGLDSVTELEKEVDIKASNLYVHLKELRDGGFLTKDTKLTEMGKIVLLHQEK
ncbi:MAG: ArsR family transcriptional regulator [Nanoarchaeota archaeon]|nr:ArsR family transcriptional regulator [Nanoarchaeota archaeon]